VRQRKGSSGWRSRTVGENTSGEGLLDDKAELEYAIDVVEKKVELLREEVRGTHVADEAPFWVGGITSDPHWLSSSQWVEGRNTPMT
jgi:hypothetical protein